MDDNEHGSSFEFIDTLSFDELVELYKKLESQNYSLKRQLKNKNNQIREMKASYKRLDEKYKKATENKKPRFRNKGKKKI